VCVRVCLCWEGGGIFLVGMWVWVCCDECGCDDFYEIESTAVVQLLPTRLNAQMHVCTYAHTHTYRHIHTNVHTYRRTYMLARTQGPGATRHGAAGSVRCTVHVRSQPQGGSGGRQQQQQQQQQQHNRQHHHNNVYKLHGFSGSTEDFGGPVREAWVSSNGSAQQVGGVCIIVGGSLLCVCMCVSVNMWWWWWCWWWCGWVWVCVCAQV